MTSGNAVAGQTQLARLLQLASPALPVGAYSYSQGLEAAVEDGTVHDAASAAAWIGDVLDLSMGRSEAPCLLRLVTAWGDQDMAAVHRWNDWFLATREAAQLRSETVQMGYSLRRLFGDLGEFDAAGLALLDGLDEPAFPTVYAFAVARWRIPAGDALVAYLWAWAENQVLAVLKAVPLGQTDGQRMLLALGTRLAPFAARAATLEDGEIGGFAPGFALAASIHETQYSRLFRS